MPQKHGFPGGKEKRIKLPAQTRMGAVQAVSPYIDVSIRQTGIRLAVFAFLKNHCESNDSCDYANQRKRKITNTM